MKTKINSRCPFYLVFYLSLILVILWSGCDKTYDEQNSELSGIWIEEINKTDTIDFDSWNSESDVFILSRGSEIRNGYQLPKQGSGPYLYELKNDTISLHFGFSSAYDFHPYFFQINSSYDSIKIGNFYDTLLPPGQPIKFYRIR